MRDVHFLFPGWKYKCVTFGYDDGCLADRRLVKMFNRHQLKATFNLSSRRTGDEFIPLGEYASLYRGHEIASHGQHHLDLNRLSKRRIGEEVGGDLRTLNGVSPAIVRGFAYPYGHAPAEAVEILRKHRIAYARTICSTSGFGPLPEDFLHWAPSMHHESDILSAAREYKTYKGWGGVLTHFFVWGHSYELEKSGAWERMEDFCRTISGCSDIWYATNLEICDYIQACRRLVSSIGGDCLRNVSALPLYLRVDNEPILLPPNASPVAVSPKRPLPMPRHYCNWCFPGGRRKALSFSYDDGRFDDRIIAIFDGLKLKGTFNLNGGAVTPELAALYQNHEIAAHSYSHVTLETVPKERILSEFYRDREVLEAAFGGIVSGAAWPNGDEAAAFPFSRPILESCGIRYARGIQSTLKFDPPEDLLRWQPTSHDWRDGDILALAERFLRDPGARPRICLIWGHGHELESRENWETFRLFCRRLAGHDTIWYATNGEIAEYLLAARSLIFSADGRRIQNPSASPVWFLANGSLCKIEAGNTLKISR